MTNPRQALQYYFKLLLALVLFTALLTLAIPAELYGSSTRVAELGGFLGLRRNLLRLMVDLLPGLLAIGAALVMASTFVASFYKLSRHEATEHIWRSIFGQHSFSPFIMVAEGQVRPGGSRVLTKLGGPGKILVYNDSAVVLERGGRLTRVLGPGKIATLAPFEKPRDVLDVRPTHWDYQVEALSREGIPVSVSADVEFQIDTGGRVPTAETPYPARDEAIFKASIGRWMLAPTAGDSFDWARRVIIGDTDESLRSIIARYRLNELIGFDSASTPATRHPRQDIQEKLKAALAQSAADAGVQINDVRLGTIKVADDVSQQWIDAWENEWGGWALVQEKAGEAERQQLRETAKAQAQVDMLTSVAQAFRESVSHDARIPSQLLVMRLLEVFDHAQISPLCYLPREAMDTLDRLREMVG